MKQVCYKKVAASINEHVKCKEIDFYVLKMIISKLMSNGANVMRTSHIYKVQQRCIGQGKT